MKKSIMLLFILFFLFFITSCNNNYSLKEKNEYKDVYQKIYNNTKYENDKVYRTIGDNDVHHGKYIINKDNSNIVFIFLDNLSLSLSSSYYLEDIKIRIYFPKRISEKYNFEYDGCIRYRKRFINDDEDEDKIDDRYINVKGEIPNTLCLDGYDDALSINYKSEHVDDYSNILKLLPFSIVHILEVYNDELKEIGSSLYSIGFNNWKETRILDDNAFYYEEKDGKIYITGFNASEYGKYRDSLIFPTKINNKDVLYVGLNCNTNNEDEDYFNKNVQIIKIPDGIEGINAYAFSNCTSLNEIHITSSLKSIKAFAFNNCRWLSTIIIPESVIEMGYDVFHDCRIRICCQMDEIPESWDDDWNLQGCNVVWGYR